MSSNRWFERVEEVFSFSSFFPLSFFLLLFSDVLLLISVPIGDAFPPIILHI